MYSYETFEIDDYFGYRILCNGSPIIVQEYAPDIDGYVKMTNDEAISNAQIILTRLVEV